MTERKEVPLHIIAKHEAHKNNLREIKQKADRQAIHQSGAFLDAYEHCVILGWPRTNTRPQQATSIPYEHEGAKAKIENLLNWREGVAMWLKAVDHTWLIEDIQPETNEPW